MNMDQIRYLYHVTNSDPVTLYPDNPALHAQVARKHPRGSEFNIKYDGFLGDMTKNPPGGVWFSATLYQGKIPTITPYPTGSPQGNKYWRLFVDVKSLNLTKDDTSLFLVQEYKESSSTTTERSLAFTREHEQEFLDQNCKKLDKDNNDYLQVDDDGNWRCPKPPIWTKICLTWDIDLTDLQYPTMFWDLVPKTNGV